MKAEEIMTRNVKTCQLSTSLAAAAMRMWDGDCGVLPVLDDNQIVIGMITDRDICIAAATQYRVASEIKVEEAIAHQLYACKPEDSLQTILSVMKEHQVRRVPVVNSYGKLEGVVSLNDIVLATKNVGEKREVETLSPEELIDTLRAICAHHSQLVTPTGRNATHLEAVA